MYAQSNRSFTVAVCLRSLVAAGLLLTQALPLFGQATERISISPNRLSGRLPGNGYSGSPSISADGRYVAFTSRASNLVPNDTNFNTDAFVFDRQTGTLTRVSTAADGTQHNGEHCAVSISANGRYVALASDATNLVPGDTNGIIDVFVKDLQTGNIERVSTASDGTQSSGPNLNAGGALSADGRYIAFVSAASNLVPGDTNDASDVFVKDRVTGVTERVSVANGGIQGNSYSKNTAISGDGRYVAFESIASNLVPGDTNNFGDVFVRGPLLPSGSGQYVTISGQITLEDLIPTAEPRLVSFTFRPNNSSGDVFQSLFIESDGQFVLTGVPANIYELHIEGLQYLSSNVQINAASGDVNNVLALLRAGDANDDDSIDVLDLDILIQAFDTTPNAPNWNGDADFNGDQSVDVLDLDLLIRNFDLIGDA